MIPLPYRILASVLIVLAILATCFYSGRRYERRIWQAKAATQLQDEVKQERTQTRTSEAVGDAHRQQATNTTQQQQATTQAAVERIRYVYRDLPSACPDARPLPDVVRVQLAEAERALAAARGLQANADK